MQKKRGATVFVCGVVIFQYPTCSMSHFPLCEWAYVFCSPHHSASGISLCSSCPFSWLNIHICTSMGTVSVQMQHVAEWWCDSLWARLGWLVCVCMCVWLLCVSLAALHALWFLLSILPLMLFPVVSMLHWCTPLLHAALAALLKGPVNRTEHLYNIHNYSCIHRLH